MLLHISYIDSSSQQIQCNNLIVDGVNKEWIILSKTELGYSSNQQISNDIETQKFTKTILGITVNSKEGTIAFNKDKKRWCFEGNRIYKAEILENEIVPIYPKPRIRTFFKQKCEIQKVILMILNKKIG